MKICASGQGRYGRRRVPRVPAEGAVDQDGSGSVWAPTAPSAVSSATTQPTGQSTEAFRIPLLEVTG
jgi:hypothetical protein